MWGTYKADWWIDWGRGWDVALTIEVGGKDIGKADVYYYTASYFALFEGSRIESLTRMNGPSRSGIDEKLRKSTILLRFRCHGADSSQCPVNSSQCNHYLIFQSMEEENNRMGLSEIRFIWLPKWRFLQVLMQRFNSLAQLVGTFNCSQASASNTGSRALLYCSGSLQ